MGTLTRRAIVAGLVAFAVLSAPAVAQKPKTGATAAKPLTQVLTTSKVSTQMLQIQAKPPSALAGAAAAAPNNTGVANAVPTQVVDLGKLPANQVKILTSGGIKQVTAGTTQVPLLPGQIVAARLPGEARPTPVTAAELKQVRGLPVSGVQLYTLPYNFVAAGNGGGGSSGGQNLELRVALDDGGMRPQAGGGFIGEIWVAIVDASSTSRPITLTPPVVVQVLAAVNADPASVPLALTNDFHKVTLQGPVSGDSLAVSVHPAFDPQGSAVDLPVHRAALDVTVSPVQIQGFGLETARVAVEAQGLPNPADTDVVLSADRGSLDTGEVHLDSGGQASATIRSISIGLATVTATSDSLTSATASVIFVFPWLFLGAALLGGAVGALVLWARADRKTFRNALLKVFVPSLLVGVFVAVCYSVGINVLDLKIVAVAGEAFIAAVAFLGAIALPKLVPVLRVKGS